MPVNGWPRDTHSLAATLPAEPSVGLCRRVAIKMMLNEDQFEREIRQRLKKEIWHGYRYRSSYSVDDHQFGSSCVMPLLAARKAADEPDPADVDADGLLSKEEFQAWLDESLAPPASRAKQEPAEALESGSSARALPPLARFRAAVNVTLAASALQSTLQASRPKEGFLQSSLTRSPRQYCVFELADRDLEGAMLRERFVQDESKNWCESLQAEPPAQ